MIEAAGGVLWRNSSSGPLEVALVHRPRYDDWSVPKGKLKAGEPGVVAAAREVAEETGYQATVGRPLGVRYYRVAGCPKRVRYWAMAARRRSEQQSSAEVDEVAWLAPDEALRRLNPDYDRGILRSFLDRATASWPLVVVRHARAGSRQRWDGPDRARPLDHRGQAQAEALASVLAAYGVERLVSADVERCVETLRPYAEQQGISVVTDARFSEDGYADDPDASVASLTELAETGQPTAVCSQGKAIPGMLAATYRLLGAGAEDTRLDKGGYCVLHLGSGARPHLVAREQSPAPA